VKMRSKIISDVYNLQPAKRVVIFNTFLASRKSKKPSSLTAAVFLSRSICLSRRRRAGSEARFITQHIHYCVNDFASLCSSFSPVCSTNLFSERPIARPAHLHSRSTRNFHFLLLFINSLICIRVPFFKFVFLAFIKHE